MRRRIGLLLAVIMTIQVFSVAVNAGWDGYIDESGSDTVLFDTSNIIKILDTGMSPVSQGVEGGAKNSVLWQHTENKAQIRVHNGLMDFSKYERMWMWIYSEKKTNSKIAFICQKASGGYYKYDLTISWEGWKKINIRMSDFAVYGDMAVKDWSDITFIDLYATGWGMTPNPDTVLYLNSIYLVTPDVQETIALDPEVIKGYLEDSSAFYIGNRQYIVDNEIKEYENGNKAIEIGGTCYVPIKIFQNVLGIDITVNEQGVLVYNNKSYDAVVKNVEGELYVPCAEIGNIAGKNVVEYGNLVVISDKKDILDIRRNDKVLDEIAREVTKDCTDYSQISQEDIEALLEKWDNYITGEDADDNEEFVKTYKNNIAESAKFYSDSMNKGSDIPILWGTEPCNNTASMGLQYTYLYKMALGYSTKNTSTYHDKVILDNILYGLEWGYNNLFGEAEVENRGWRDTSEFNWFEWQITVPRELTKTLLLIREDIDKKTMLKYLKIVDYFTNEKFGNLLTSSATGANIADTAYPHIISKLLQADAQEAAKFIALITRDLAYQTTPSGQGQQPDGSYRFHYRYAMNGTYGLSFMSAAVPILNIVDGTKFEIIDFNKDEYIEWLFNAYETSIFDGRIMSVFLGRAPGGEFEHGREIIANLVEMTEVMDGSEKLHLQSIIKYWAENNYVDISSFTLNQYRIITEILGDDTIKARESYIDFNMFYNTDKAIWNNNDYAMAISMSSERISGWESINGENKKGWYMGDGMVYLYRKDDPNSYTAPFWKDVNYYHLPGTTVDTQERVAESIHDQQMYLSSQDFVGGVNFMDKYGACAMILESCHNENESTMTSDYGNALPVHINDLMAQKAYFVFDDEMVCLGSGINSTMNVDVQTIVENRRAMVTENKSSQILETYEIKSVTASDEPQAENPAKNIMDKDFGTRWSAEGEQNLVLDLGEVKTVGMVGIAVMNGTTRTTAYDIYLSEDGINYTEIYSGNSSGTTDNLEVYDGKGINARYIKFDFHGNSQGPWNSVTEIEIFPPREDGIIEIPETDYHAKDKLYIDGEETFDDHEIHTKNSVNYAWLENGAGYVFLTPTRVSWQKTNTASAFNELWIEHGKNPVNAGYEYVILPDATSEQTKQYSSNPDVEIISNTNKLQAVREKNLDIEGYIFYEAGQTDTIKVDQPCIVMLKQDENRIEISLSEPTQKNPAVVLNLNYEGFSIDAEASDVEVSEENGEIIFDTDSAFGKTIKAVLTK